MITTVLCSLVSLLLLCIVYFVFIRRYALDGYREELFKIRDGLFNLALDSDSLGFRSEVYKNFELLINNNIRFAHKISFLSLILFDVLNRIRYPGKTIHSKLASDLVQQISGMRPSDSKARIMGLKAAFDTQTILYLLRTSPLFFLFVSIVAFSFAMKKLFKPERLRSLVKKYLVGEVNREIELQAENYCLVPM